MKRVRFVTLGCKVNQYETQAMRESLHGAGIAEEGEGPSDFVVVNTCTVTAEADRENRYWIRRLARENPQAKIVVTGCWVERNRKEIETLSEVDLVLSNQEKPDLVEHLLEGCGSPAVQNRESHSRHAYSPLQISSFQGHARAFIKIQDGCNHACAFCKVVLVRGRSRSRGLSEIVDEAKRLRDSGYRELVLTGIQLGAYGLDLPPLTHNPLPPWGRGEGEGVNLVSVLEALSSISGIERIRLSSIEPTDVKPELIEAMKELPKICPQLHVPLQSGDDEILRRMNRRYGRDFYLNLVHDLRQALPDFCLSMDVMAGFPGEAESHFQNTLSAVEETRPIRVHVFPYSRRERTRASRFEDLPQTVVRERVNRLIRFSQDMARREKQKFLGRIFPVLVEKRSSRGELYQGHTPHYLKVYFQASDDSLGRSVPVRLVAVLGDGVIGHAQGGLPE